jgi:autotransporter translocation and assembly factor TamB
MRELLRDAKNARALWEAASLDLELQAGEIEPFAWISPGERRPPLTGRLGGDLRIVGPNLTPDVEGTVRARDLVAGGVHVPAAEARLRVEEGDVLLERGWVLVPDPWVRFESRLPLELSLARAPHWQPERGMRLWIDSDGTVDLGPVRSIWPHFEEFEGRGEIQFEATGDPREPLRNGFIRVHGGAVRYEGTLEQIREIEVDAAFHDGVLVIDRAFGREAKNGEIDAHGEIVFKGLLPDDIWLDIDVHRFLLMTVPYLRAIATSQGPLQLRLARPAVPDASRVPRLTGSVVIDKAIYQGDFAEQNQDPTLGATTAPDWMAQLQVQLEKEVRISNRDLDLLVVGDADYIRDARGVRLRGVVEIIQGRMPIFGNDFTLIEGTLDFSRRPLEPEVDIVAETKMPISSEDGSVPELERVTVYFTGTFAEPELRFESETNLPEATILRALVGFYDADQGSGETAAVEDVGVRAGFNVLERGLTRGYARQLGLDTIDIEADEATIRDLERTRIAVGKYVTIPWIERPGYLRYSKGLQQSTWGLFVEYQLWWNFIISGGYETRPDQNLQGVDIRKNLDLKWRLRR